MTDNPYQSPTERQLPSMRRRILNWFAYISLALSFTWTIVFAITFSWVPRGWPTAQGYDYTGDVVDTAISALAAIVLLCVPRGKLRIWGLIAVFVLCYSVIEMWRRVP